MLSSLSVDRVYILFINTLGFFFDVRFLQITIACRFQLHSFFLKQCKTRVRLILKCNSSCRWSKVQIKSFLPTNPSPPMTPLTEKLVTLGSFAKTSPTKIKNTCCFKCNCQKKPGSVHGSRLADSFQIPTTDNLSHMIKNGPFLSGFGFFACEQSVKFGVTCASYFT